MYQLSSDAWAGYFDEVHGRGSYEMLLSLFADPSISYAEIGKEYGVSRERARQWHDRIYPEAAGTGRERQRSASFPRRQKNLFHSQKFSDFYRIARKFFPEESIEPILRNYAYGRSSWLRMGAVRINGKKILLRKATRDTIASYNREIHYLRGSKEDACGVFYLLDGDNFLFIPKSAISKKTAFLDSDGCKYYRFKNNFDALDAG